MICNSLNVANFSPVKVSKMYSYAGQQSYNNNGQPTFRLNIDNENLDDLLNRHTKNIDSLYDFSYSVNSTITSFRNDIIGLHSYINYLHYSYKNGLNPVSIDDYNQYKKNEEQGSSEINDLYLPGTNNYIPE